jgi:hypothetical protein
MIAEKQIEKIPFEDEFMRYDKMFHRYILKEDAISNLLNINMEDDATDKAEVNAICNDISTDVYNFIYSFKETMQFPKMEYLLATRDFFREGVMQMMLAEIRYWFESRGTSIKFQHGINIEKANQISVETLRGEMRVSQPMYEEAIKYGFMNKTFFDSHARFTTLLQRGVDY